MTIKEALSTKVKSLSLTSGEIDLALLEAGLDGASAYDPTAQGMEVDLVWAGFLLTTIQVTELKEDDVSIKYSNNLKDIVSAIYLKWGLVDPFAIAKPTVKQVNLW